MADLQPGNVIIHNTDCQLEEFRDITERTETNIQKGVQNSIFDHHNIIYMVFWTLNKAVYQKCVGRKL